MSAELTYLIWSNDHRLWWRANERGYTEAIEEAGRYPHDRAAEIVRRATVDGHLLRDRTNPVTGEQYRQAPEVLVLAPECIESGSTRPALMRVMTDDRCYRVFEPRGIGTGALTYYPYREVLEADWLPPQHRGHGISAAQICAGILDLHGDDALWQHLEQTYWQLKTTTGGAP
jgi:hypothetical protein